MCIGFKEKENIIKQLDSVYNHLGVTIHADKHEIEANGNLMDKILYEEDDIFAPRSFDNKIEKECLKHTGFNINTLLEIVDVFYKKHPFLVPFVGKHYGNLSISDKKIRALYVLESHYLPDFSMLYRDYLDLNKKEAKNNWLKENWYENNLWWEDLHSQNKIALYKEDVEYMWTESVLRWNIEHNKKFQHLFKTMLMPLNENLDDSSKQDISSQDGLVTLVNSVAFMNYFLRPSEHHGSSIQHEYIDSYLSYFNLVKVWMKMGKPRIVICSSKVRNSFVYYNNKFSYIKSAEKMTRCNQKICLCNHPNNRSWNRKIKSEHADQLLSSAEIQNNFWEFIKTDSL